MLKNKKAKISLFKIVGALLMVFSAVLLLWHGNITSNQAMTAMVAKVYFDGELSLTEVAEFR